ncbi:MAG: PD40 domain-containing protein [Planctomycetes bacterium]|nr:PD40 domain-containing protein [Planctomycetota bacterium]
MALVCALVVFAAPLAEEVRGLGWIVYSARSDAGDWDIFVMRPDGSNNRNITRTKEYGEVAPQVSRDGRRLLYRRLPRDEKLDDNAHGTQGELVIANADGTGAEAFGAAGEYTWASWSPDGKELACLTIKGILFVDVATKDIVRTLPRKGFFQQMTWSPDGQWLCGVANSFGAAWSIARMNVSTGEASAVSRINCCTPDWFPDGERIIFSSRPPGQKTNDGYGWTQLWMADAEGTSRQLVYGEDGRHVYGGCVSPDGKYVIFTGNQHEDGDPGRSGAPMAILRLADAPMIRGRSEELRALHPEAKSGTVLELPSGWEPCWTAAEIGGDGASALGAEVREKGWIVYSAEVEDGTWDLFLMRPDGSAARKLTDTREYDEAGARFSPDGKRLLFYRIPASEPVDNNTYGTYSLVIADADGGRAQVFGNDFPWASWGPDGTRIACLDRDGIRIIDVATRAVVKELPRRAIFQQLVWSPDGASFAGTANGLGVAWTVARLDPVTGAIDAASETDRYNCTPDWMPDSKHIIYARGIVPDTKGWAALWMTTPDGADRRILYAEDGRNIYGGCASPDGAYFIFTRSVADLGRADRAKTRMALVRAKDAAAAGRARLDLPLGWEPHWTYADVGEGMAGEGEKQ